MKLENKQILFIAPVFFGYEKKIAEKMIELGAKVDFFDERSITSSIERALLKISPRIFHNKTIRYYSEIIKRTSKNNYDYIFVIKCEMMPLEIISKLKEIFPSASLCLYLYDSLNNIRGIKSKINAFDRVLSFDLEDAKENENIMFRPLFFLDNYKKEFSKKDKYKYDISFVGTIHSDRYKIIKKIISISKNNGISYFFYCYLQSKFMYYFYKITLKEFRCVDIKDFEFEKIESQKIAEIIDETKVVLDIQHPKQTGLTMRTIEMVGMNKKLITTNQSISQYDFYNPTNIAIIDRNRTEIPEEFFTTSFKKVEDKIYNRYSLESWIFEVLGLES